VVFTPIALEREVIEIVTIGVFARSRDPIDPVPVKRATLTSNHYVRGAAASHFPSSMPNRGIGFVSIRTHIDAILSRALNLEGQVRSGLSRIDLRHRCAVLAQ